MVKHLKLIIYLIPLFICFSLFSISGFCAALPDYILDQSSLSVVQGGFGSIEEYGLSSGHVNLFSLPIFVTEQLNPYLYQTHGWDLDDVADVALSPLDPTSATTQEGIKLWSSFDPTLNSTAVIGSALENGFRVLEMKAAAAGSMARTFGRGARSFVLGKINEGIAGGAAFVSDVKDNLLVKLGSDFSEVWSDNYDALVDSGDIFEVSDSSIFYTSSLSCLAYNVYTYSSDIVFNINFPDSYLFYTSSPDSYGNMDVFLVVPANTSISTITGSVFVVSGGFVVPLTIYLDSNGLLYDSNNIAYDTYYIQCNNGVSTFSSVQTKAPFCSRNDLISYLTANGYPSFDASSINYYSSTVEGTPFNLRQLLSQLDGKYATSEQLGNIKTILDNNAFANTQADGAGQIFTDDSLQDLIDAINDIINQQDDLEDALPDPDPDPDPNPDPDYTDIGISVPPDYPTTTFDTLNDVISSPLEFFSIFEPIFLIFGSNALMIFSMWLFVPCVLIIAFIIWALK